MPTTTAAEAARKRKLREDMFELMRKENDPNFVKYAMWREGYDEDVVDQEFQKMQKYGSGQPVQENMTQDGGFDSDYTKEITETINSFGAESERGGSWGAIATLKSQSDMEKAIKNLETGPVAGKLQKASSRYLDSSSKEFRDFQAASTLFTAHFIKAISGAQVSDKEREFLMEALPSIDKQEGENLAGLQAIETWLRDTYEPRIGTKIDINRFYGETGQEMNQPAKNTGQIDQSEQARQWLEANPNDPRAEKVRAKLEMETTKMTPPLQRQDELDQEEKGFLSKAGSFAQDVLGGKQIGEAIGSVLGASIAKHGVAGEIFKKSIADRQKRFQEGRISEEERDEQIKMLEKNAKETFGYDGPNAKQIIGDLATIGLNFVGGAALKGGAGILKMSAIGALTGGAAAMAEDESIGQGAIIGGVLGGSFGLIGRGVSKIGSKLASNADVEGRAIKLASEILQPSKKEASLAIEKGGSSEAVKALVKNVKKSENFSELRSHMAGTTEALFEKRNNLLRTNNFDVGEKYLEPLKENIAKLEKDKLVSPAQIERMKQALEQESAWLAEQGGTVSRLQAQARKEALQDLTQPLLKKRDAGNLSLNEANTMKALDAIRFGLKEAVEGGDKVVASLNSQYAGLNRAIQLISGREAMALNATELSTLQKVVAPIIELMSASTGAGSSQFVARLASKQQSKLIKLTGQLEKLSQGKGGVFSDVYNFLKKFQGKQGKIGNFLDGLDDFTEKAKSIR